MIGKNYKYSEEWSEFCVLWKFIHSNNKLFQKYMRVIIINKIVSIIKKSFISHIDRLFPAQFFVYFLKFCIEIYIWIYTHVCNSVWLESHLELTFNLPIRYSVDSFFSFGRGKNFHFHFRKLFYGTSRADRCSRFHKYCQFFQILTKWVITSECWQMGP